MWQKDFLKTFLPCGKCFAIAICVGSVCFALCGIIVLCRRLRSKKEQKAEEERALQYALPDRENEFVRARLKTVLCKEEGEDCDGVNLAYARELLSKLYASPVTMAEKLELSEIGALFALCMRKETLTASEVRMLSDALSRLLKLSAKYSL